MLWTLPDMDRIKARVDAEIRNAVVVGGGVLRKDNPPPVMKNFLGRMFGFMLPSGARRLALSKLHMLGAAWR